MPKKSMAQEYEDNNAIREAPATYQTAGNLALNPDAMFDEFPQYAADLSKLTTKQRLILTELTINLISEDKKTDIEIADSLDIDRNTVYLARQNTHFARCLAYMTIDITKGLVDKAVGNLLKMTDNVKAQEILLRIAEVYNPTQRLLTLSGKLPTDMMENITSPQQITSQICSQFASLGYSKERLIDEISTKWDELKENGSI